MSYPPPSYAPPPASAQLGSLYGNRESSSQPPPSSAASRQSGLTLQLPSQVESIPHYGAGYGGVANHNQFVNPSPRSQNYYHVDRYSPSSASSVPSAGRTLSRKKSSNRISPAQMPRPDKPQTDLIYHTKSGTGRRNPPVVNSLYVAVDTGNANPRFMRTTMVAPPTTPELLRNTTLPFSLHVTPFASLAPGEEPIPLISYDQSPPRCKQCGGYVCPYVTWIENGDKWQCALCQTTNITPEWYKSSLDGAGQRTDRVSRPELTRGTVDFLLPPALFNNEPAKENIIVFAIDISLDAVQQGFALASLRAIKSVLRSLFNDYQHRVKRAREQFRQRQQPSQHGPNTFYRPTQSSLPHHPSAATAAASAEELDHQLVMSMVEDYQIGILTFHSQLQFFDVRLPVNEEDGPTGDATTILDPVHVMMGEVDDPFCPLPMERWLCRFSQARDSDKLFTLLDKLPTLLNQLSVSTGTLPRHDPHHHRRFVAPAAAIVAVEEALRDRGGRLYVYSSHHSTIGIGSSSNSNNSNSQSSVSSKLFRESLATGAHGTADELLLYTCPGAKKTFLDRVHTSTSTATSTVTTSGFLSMALNFASGGTVGVNNAGNGVDKKVSAVPSQSTATNGSGSGYGNRSVSSSVLSNMANGNSNGATSGNGTSSQQTSANQTREKIREGRIHELLGQHQWYWDLAESCVLHSSLTVTSFLGVGDLYVGNSDSGGGTSQFPLVGVGNAPNYNFFDTTHFADLAMRTGGKVFLARGSMLLEDNVTWMENQLAHELLRGGATYQGRDVTMKLRLSRHFAVEQFFGGGIFEALEEEWRLPSVDATTSAMFSFGMAGVLKDEERVCIQLAALYTTPRKERRLRVHNLSVIASEKPTTVYRNCDIEALICAYGRVAANKALEHSLNEETQGPRQYLQSSLVNLLVKYRHLCSSTSPKSQLVLPESLKVMPMLILGLLKHPALIENTSTIATNSSSSSSNNNNNNNNSNNATPRGIGSQSNYANVRVLSHASERAWELRRMFTQPIREIVNSVHPKVLSMFAILDSDMHARRELYSNDLHSDGSLPPTMNKEDDWEDYGSEDEDEEVDDEYGEMSPEKQEDRSHWTIAQGEDTRSSAGNLSTAFSTTNFEMLGGDGSSLQGYWGPGNVGLSLSQSTSLMNVNALSQQQGAPSYHVRAFSLPPPPPPPLPSSSSAISTNNSTGFVVTGAPIYSPPATTPPPSATNLAGYSLAGAMYANYPAANATNATNAATAATAAASTGTGDRASLSIAVGPPRTKHPHGKKTYLRPLRLLRRQGCVHTARRIKLLTLQTLQACSAEFDTDQLYVVDDRSVLWVYVGRAMSQELLEEIFNLPAHAPFERPNDVSIRTSTALGRRIKLFLDLLAADAPYKPELKVIWAELSPSQNQLLHKFSTRLLEDASAGVLSYTDFLCNIHNKIQMKL